MMSLRNFEKSVTFGNAKCSLDGRVIRLNGQKGEIESSEVPSFIDIKIEDNQINLALASGFNKQTLDNSQRAMIGTVKSLLKSMIKGVNEGHEVPIIFTGTGVGIELKNNQLHLKIGKSHIVVKEVPKGVVCTIPTGNIKVTKLIISGVDLCKVMQLARELCDLSKNRYQGGVHIFLEKNPPVLKKGKK